jgi:hypothetical protein
VLLTGRRLREGAPDTVPPGQTRVAYQDVLDNIRDGVYFVDRERRLTFWNHAATEISGHPRESGQRASRHLPAEAVHGAVKAGRLVCVCSRLHLEDGPGYACFTLPPAQAAHPRRAARRGTRRREPAVLRSPSHAMAPRTDTAAGGMKVTARQLAARAASNEDPALWRDEVCACVGRLFETTYARQGALPPFCVDGHTGQVLGEKDLLPELADYLPLLLAAGRREYVVAQGEIVRRRLARDRLVANPDPGLWPWLRRTNPFYYGDLILGLLLCHDLGMGSWWLEEARRQTDWVIRRFLYRGALVKEVLVPSGLALPASESNSLLMVELLVDLHGRSGGDRHDLELAASLLAPWRELAEADGAVPQLRLLHPALAAVPRFAARRHVYPLYKHNLCFLAALFSLAESRNRPDEKEAAIASALRAARFFRKDDGPFAHAVRRRGPGFSPETASLKGTLLAEHLCDLGVAAHRDDLVSEAASQCRWWLERCHPATGLIAYWENGHETDVDSLTDFAVTLLKLFAATRDQGFRASACGLLRAMLRFHLGEHGLVSSVDTRNGSVCDHRVETRLTSLFLKPWLLLPVAEGIYQDPCLLGLVRDR